MAPASASAQTNVEVVVKVLDGRSIESAVHVTRAIADPELLRQQIAQALDTARIEHTPADVAVVAGTATAQWSQWHQDFVIAGKCDADEAFEGTAPSGLAYVVECRNCRPARC